MIHENLKSILSTGKVRPDHQSTVDYLKELVAAGPQLEIVCASSKRTSVINGEQITFNQSKSKFYRVLGPLISFQLDVNDCIYGSEFGCRTDCAPSVFAVAINPTAQEREHILTVWRVKKAVWMHERGLLRDDHLIQF